MANLIAAFYDSSLTQSILALNIAKLKFKLAGKTFTVKDLNGDNEAAILNHIDEFTVGTLDDIAVCCLTAATHATGKMTWDQVAYLDTKLVTANKGTSIRAGTCQANATVTEIVLDASASAVNDFYNFTRFGQEYYIKTAGVTAIYRYIADYVGATVTATVVSTSTAITTTETFIVYSQEHVWLLGDANSTQNACRIAWTECFGGTDNIPLLVSAMGGYGTGFKNCPRTVLTCDSVAASSITDGAIFTLAQYDGGDYWVALLNNTGGTYTLGQAGKILSNTTTVLTLTEPWTVTPTSTPNYAIYLGGTLLYDVYLNLSIPTYLYADNDVNFGIFKSMLDRYGDIEKQSLDTAQTYQDIATLAEYAALGKAIHDAQSATVVT